MLGSQIKSLCAAAIVIGLTAVAPATGLAAPQCFEATNAPDNGPIKRILVEASAPQVIVEEWSLPHQYWISEPDCSLPTTSPEGMRRCVVVCEEGSVDLGQMADGRLFVRLDGLAFDSSVIQQSILDASRYEDDAAYFSGNFVLTPKPPEYCQQQQTALDIQSRQSVRLREGDLSPLVADVETDLQRLGYSVGLSDGVFTDELKSVVQNFQESTGLPVTGEIDGLMMMKINVLVHVDGSGC